VSYAIAAAATLFLLATAAGSDIHMEEMLAGSILWVQWPAIIICALIYTITSTFHYIFRDKFIKLSSDYQGAMKDGMNVMWWDFLFYALMGIIITYTVEIAGVLLVFSFLIIPATFASLFAQTMRNRLIIAWILGAFASLCGLIFSFRYDFSCGPSIISFLGLFLIIASIVRNVTMKSS
ncbi:unnamed protein product, partial [marine sediment metagenome]